MTGKTAPLGDGFDQPQEIPEVIYTFPADVSTLMPKWSEIPEEFKHRGAWVNYSRTWFYQGFTGLYTRDDISGDIAYRHLTTILRSFQPQHEHKIAAVAWLSSRWFDSIPEKGNS